MNNLLELDKSQQSIEADSETVPVICSETLFHTRQSKGWP